MNYRQRTKIVLLVSLTLAGEQRGKAGDHSHNAAAHRRGGANTDHSPRYNIVDLGTLGGVASDAAAINAAGDIVGSAQTTGEVAGMGGEPVVWHGAREHRVRLLPASMWIYANAINRSGQVVGEAYSRHLAHHAALWSHGRTDDLGTLGGAASRASAINDRGWVVGTSDARRGDSAPTHAFLWHGGRMRDLGTLGGQESYAFAINKQGIVVGLAELRRKGGWHAVFWFRGRVHDLGTFGGPKSEAHGINGRGEIVGWAQKPHPVEDRHTMSERAFLYKNGRMRELPSIYHKPCRAEAINNRGQIVGQMDPPLLGDDIEAEYREAVGMCRATVWAGGRNYDLNRLIPRHSGWFLYDAVGINDKGQIVGSGIHFGNTRAFLLIPR